MTLDALSGDICFFFFFNIIYLVLWCDVLLNCHLFREFCCMVRKIFIYTREEVQKMSPGTLNSHGEGNQVSVEVMDAKEKPQTLPLSSIPANC